MNIATLAAGVVGAVFVYAGVAKILAGRKWPASARNLGIPPIVASSVMLGEVVIGSVSYTHLTLPTKRIV